MGWSSEVETSMKDKVIQVCQAQEYCMESQKGKCMDPHFFVLWSSKSLMKGCGQVGSRDTADSYITSIE